MMPKVYNKRQKDVPTDAVYVGRPTKWGNPFGFFGVNSNKTLQRVQTRDEAVNCYKKWLETKRPNLIEAAKLELKGKDLVCWCAPARCHADVLLEIANEKL
jgi:hypothetical protein